MVIRLNWLEKIKLRRYAGPPGCQYYLLLITVVRVSIVRNDAKRNWKGRNKVLFVKFVSLVAFQLRGPEPHWATPLATPMILRQDRALKFFHKKNI